MTDNAVAAEVLIRLARLAGTPPLGLRPPGRTAPRHRYPAPRSARGQFGGGGDSQYLDWARTALSTFVRDYERYGAFAAGYALAVEQLLSEPLQVVVVGSAEDPKRLELLRAAWRPYTLNRALLAVDPLWEAEPLRALGYPAEPAPRAYVCLGHTCAEPAAEASQVAAAIKRLSHTAS